ncbi:uncharacterized protein [Dermacentor andersoni]|uniref:uncharacterized protein isoform X2 n=1 Tax=Dermacentor andersoni TaxID=34620 RepID=UPI00241618DC|nr:uncharacterized protein LOC129387229 isoform X2 [Dermacentor andersoni]
MGLIHSLPANVADARERWQQRLRRWQAGERGSDEEEEDEEALSEVVVIGGCESGEPAHGAGPGKAAFMQQQQQQQASAAGDRSLSPRIHLPEVDTDDAVKIWCSRSQPSQVTQGGPSAWLEAEQERSSSSGSEYELDDEEDEEDEEGEEDEASSEGSTETSTSSTSTIPSGMLRQWRRIRKCYADNPDVIGDILVYRVLTYMGHPHWRKSSGGGCASAAGDSPNLTTVLQATMALRLEDLRQKKLQMEAAWRAMKKKAPPISRVVLEAKRRAVQQLEKELMSLHEASSKMGSGKTRCAKSEKAAAAECAQGQ